jgi:hypothetical protein
MHVFDTRVSDALDVTDEPATFALRLEPHARYQFTATVDTWIRQARDDEPGTTEPRGEACALIARGAPVYLDGLLGSVLSVVADKSKGRASITRVQVR